MLLRTRIQLRELSTILIGTIQNAVIDRHITLSHSLVLILKNPKRMAKRTLEHCIAKFNSKTNRVKTRILPVSYVINKTRKIN